MKIIALGSGHGGIIEGQYVTPGKRYYGLHGGKQIQLAEGAFNRYVLYGVIAQLHLRGVKVANITPEDEDISLRARVMRVNALCRKYGKNNVYYMSIHHNSFTSDSVFGTEIFTSLGETGSDPIAEFIGERFVKRFGKTNFRMNNVNSKEYSKDANYQVLRNTYCRASLMEWGFMSNTYDRTRIIDKTQDEVIFLTDVLEEIYQME